MRSGRKMEPSESVFIDNNHDDGMQAPLLANDEHNENSYRVESSAYHSRKKF